MPRAAWVDDLDVLDAIETALSAEERAVLHGQLDDLGIERDSWLEIPALRQVFAFFAFANLTRAANGLSQEEARARAEHRLGIPEGTLKSWIRRWGVGSI